MVLTAPNFGGCAGASILEFLVESIFGLSAKLHLDDWKKVGYSRLFGAKQSETSPISSVENPQSFWYNVENISATLKKGYCRYEHIRHLGHPWMFRRVPSTA